MYIFKYLQNRNLVLLATLHNVYPIYNTIALSFNQIRRDSFFISTSMIDYSLLAVSLKTAETSQF